MGKPTCTCVRLVLYSVHVHNILCNNDIINQKLLSEECYDVITTLAKVHDVIITTLFMYMYYVKPGRHNYYYCSFSLCKAIHYNNPYPRPVSGSNNTG